MPYYLETDDRKKLKELLKYQVCAECGGQLEAFFDLAKHLPYVQCKANPDHNGIQRPASAYEQRGIESLNIVSRRELMENRFGPQATALEKYQGITALTKAQAKEILMTVFPDAPEAEMARAIMLCASYHLNPLMGHLFLIPFKGKDNKTTYATVMGIKAKRLLASRRRSFSYVDDTPRLMSEEEQKKIYGKVDAEHIVAITVLRDPNTGAEARGYGKWGKSIPVYGTEKGNSQENMAFIRSESQALDRLCPGEMPADIEVIDEQFAPKELAENPKVIEGEVKGKAESKSTAIPSKSSKSVSSDLKGLLDMMKLCNWSAQDFGQFCVSKGWKIKVYEDLSPEQITESTEHISRNPK